MEEWCPFFKAFMYIPGIKSVRMRSPLDKVPPVICRNAPKGDYNLTHFNHNNIKIIDVYQRLTRTNTMEALWFLAMLVIPPHILSKHPRMVWMALLKLLNHRTPWGPSGIPNFPFWAAKMCFSLTMLSNLRAFLVYQNVQITDFSLSCHRNQRLNFVSWNASVVKLQMKLKLPFSWIRMSLWLFSMNHWWVSAPLFSALEPMQRGWLK